MVNSFSVRDLKIATVYLHLNQTSHLHTGGVVVVLPDVVNVGTGWPGVNTLGD